MIVSWLLPGLGLKGKVIGVDMTPEMLDKAREMPARVIIKILSSD